MKGTDPSLFGALLLSVMVRSLLLGQALYWSRAGMLMLLPGILISALAGILFAHAWPQARNRFTELIFILLLVLGAVLDLLSLWNLYTAVYPDAVSLVGICLTALVPVLYLRRVSSIAQTSNVVLGLLFAAGLILVFSVSDRLAVTNLRVEADPQDLQTALAAQCALSQELLLPALRQKKHCPVNRTVFRLALFAGLFQAGLHLLLELFFGAAMPEAVNPLHQAARCGNLSIFDRLEWLQLIVWTMAISVKLGLYGYAAAYLFRVRSADENSLKGLPQFVCIGAALMVLCTVLARQELSRLFVWQNYMAWSLLGIVILWGGIRWLIQKPASGSA